MLVVIHRKETQGKMLKRQMKPIERPGAEKTGIITAERFRPLSVNVILRGLIGAGIISVCSSSRYI